MWHGIPSSGVYVSQYIHGTLNSPYMQLVAGPPPSVSRCALELAALKVEHGAVRDFFEYRGDEGEVGGV